MEDLILRLNVQFSDEEKQLCLPIARQMVHLAIVSVEGGILGLESEVLSNDSYSTLTKIGMNMILEPAGSERMKKFFQHVILSGGYKGTDLLERLLIAEGFLAIAPDDFRMPNGSWALGPPSYHVPTVVAYHVGAILGEEYIEELLATANKTDIDIDAYIDQYTSPLEESTAFEEKLLTLTNIGISHLLMPMDDFVLAMAFVGCSKSFIYYIQKKLPHIFFIRICAAFATPICHTLSKTEILQHQEVVLNQLKRLEATF